MNIWAESSDNNARVCKPEYFKKCNDRPCYECLLRCVSRVNTHYSAILIITVLQMVYEINNTVSFFYLILTTTISPQPKRDIVLNVLR
jgi:hypothetical protein